MNPRRAPGGAVDASGGARHNAPMRYRILFFSALAPALLVSGCSSTNAPVPVAGTPEPSVIVRDSLTRAAAVLEIGGRKVEVQKVYVQHRLIYSVTPAGAKPFELLDNNVLLIGRIEIHLTRLDPGVYRLDGDGSLNRVADGAAKALVAWNDDSAWIAPKPAKFSPEF